MLKKLKKIPRYAFKVAAQSNYLDLIRVLKYVKSKHLLSALAACADKQPIAVELRKQSGLLDLQLFLKVIPYRRARLSKDFFLWSYKGRQFCGTYNQFMGLYAEYLSGQFEDSYAINWKNKRVLDVGGFIGDSALYMLEKGAKQVIIYEPIPENIFALSYNLQAYKDKIQVHQQAVTQKDGPIILSSNHPAGSLGFGMEEGKYQIKCEGISLSKMLARHQIDVVKLDCEGGEKYLVDLSSKEIQSIPYWIVETHSPEIYRKVKNKFDSEGFDKVKECTLTPQVSLLHFERKL